MAKKTISSTTLLGPDGNPFKSDVLTSEYAPPTTTGVRSPWSDSIASGLDPSQLAALLKSANAGDNHDYLVLAEEMEERDAHYASVLGQRKRAVSGIDPIVIPASDSPEDQEIATAVEALVADPIFADVVDDLLDGIAKGYSVVETIWKTDENLWSPEEYIYRDPRHFQFDKKTGRELRIRDDDNDEGLEIKPYAMMIHRPKLKSGLSVRGGLARVVMWCFMLKSYTLQDWAAFLEVFGMPLRVGKYDNNAKPEEKKILLRAVRDLGSDAAAIIPKGMEIEFIQATGGQGNAVFGSMAGYLDKQISKAVIGQTMTTDEGSSNSQSETHNDVRSDITKADARQMGTTVNRDLVVPYVAFNFGPDKAVPKVFLVVEDAEDIKAMSETLGLVVPLGVRVATKDVNKRIGFRVPDADEEVLKSHEPAAKTDAALASSTGQRGRHCPSCGEVHLAAAQVEEDDPLVTEALSHWEADMTPAVSAILEAAKSVDSYEGFLAALDDIALDTDPLARRLAAQMMKAKGNGLANA